MPRGIIKLDDNKFIEWSTVVDAPVSYIFDKKEAEEQVKSYPQACQELFKETEMTFTSITVEQILNFNRAGVHKNCISKEQIIEDYTNRTERR